MLVASQNQMLTAPGAYTAQGTLRGSIAVEGPKAIAAVHRWVEKKFVVCVGSAASGGVVGGAMRQVPGGRFGIVLGLNIAWHVGHRWRNAKQNMASGH